MKYKKHIPLIPSWLLTTVSFIYMDVNTNTIWWNPRNASSPNLNQMWKLFISQEQTHEAFRSNCYVVIYWKIFADYKQKMIESFHVPPWGFGPSQDRSALTQKHLNAITGRGRGEVPLGGLCDQMLSRPGMVPSCPTDKLQLCECAKPFSNATQRTHLRKKTETNNTPTLSHLEYLRNKEFSQNANFSVAVRTCKGPKYI